MLSWYNTRAYKLYTVNNSQLRLTSFKATQTWGSDGKFRWNSVRDEVDENPSRLMWSKIWCSVLIGVGNSCWYWCWQGWLSIVNCWLYSRWNILVRLSVLQIVSSQFKFTGSGFGRQRLARQGCTDRVTKPSGCSQSVAAGRHNDRMTVVTVLMRCSQKQSSYKMCTRQEGQDKTVSQQSVSGRLIKIDVYVMWRVSGRLMAQKKMRAIVVWCAVVVVRLL